MNKDMFNDGQSRGFAIKVLDAETAKAQGILASRAIVGILDQGLAVDTVVEVEELPAVPDKGIFYLTSDGGLYVATNNGYLEVVNPDGIAWGDIVGHPTKLSEFENDPDFTTRTEVEAIASDIPKFAISVVEELPQNPSTTTIYLLLSQEQGADNLFTEYIYVNGEWEKLGEQPATIDLSNYYTKTETDDLLDDFLDEYVPNALTSEEYESLFV